VLCNDCHVAGCRVMVFVLPAIGVDKIGIITAPFLSRFVIR
jgi:hypothetical protein